MHITGDYDKAILSLSKAIENYKGTRIAEMYKVTLEDVKRAKNTIRPDRRDNTGQPM